MKEREFSTEAFMSRLIEAAKQHGIKSDPEMEVGDLQMLLKLCWDALPREERIRVAKHWAIEEILGWE